ncbi:MAG: hypothetical protein RLZZ500_1531 [Bacteroidota bacterium]|jgi:hypothetical protein
MAKLAVYDTSKGFSSFVKHYFAKRVDIEVCTSKKKFSLDWFRNFQHCFFVVNDIEDLFNLMKVADLNNEVIAGSPSRILEMKIKNVNDHEVKVMDFSLNKNELMLYIDNYLKSNKLVE